jgi:hypothetical protein
MNIEKCVDELMLEYCRRLADSGFDRDEINQILTQRAPEIAQWRKVTMATIARFVDEPDAPSHEVQ